MTIPPDPYTPVSLAPGTTPAAVRDAARTGLHGARADVDGATCDARRGLQVAWESVAADRFRDAVRVLLTVVDRDAGLLADADAVLAR